MTDAKKFIGPDEPRTTPIAPTDFEIDVVIISYNSEKHISKCLASLLEQRNVDIRIHIGDNGSADKTIDIVNAFSGCGKLRVARFRTNPGFGYTCNRMAQGGSAPLLLLLNPDTAFDGESTVLLRHAQLLYLNDEIGAIGPALWQENGRFDHAAKRSEPTITSTVAYLCGKLWPRQMGRLGEHYRAGHVGIEDFAEVDAVNGAYMMMRRSTFEMVGGFDENFWMYGEDLDLCRRIRLTGMRVVYDGTSNVTHLKGGTQRSGRSLRSEVAFWESMGIYYTKHHLSRCNRMSLGLIWTFKILGRQMYRVKRYWRVLHG